jgi:hypothetical protein
LPAGEWWAALLQTRLREIAVFEVLEVDDKIRKLAIGKASAKEITKQARHDGLLTLRGPFAGPTPPSWPRLPLGTPTARIV